MPKTAELKLRIDPELKSSVTELYRTWGLNLSDAVNIFFNQSLVYGGLPFDMRKPIKKLAFDWNSPAIVAYDKAIGHAVLPVEWDEPEDAFYDTL